MDGLIPDTRDRPGQPGLEVAPPTARENTAYDHYGPKPPPSNELTAKPSHRICGLSSHLFWIIFAVVLVVLGGAIGGGVGGGLSAAHKNKNVSVSSEQNSSSVSSIISSTTSSIAISSSSTSTGIPPSSTQPGIYRIINIASNTAIDLYGGGTSNDTTIECWSWDPFSTPTEYAHQSWQISSEVSGSIVIFNTHTNSYITAPSNLTAGVNPSDNLDAQVYGGVPGSSTDQYMQWVIIQNNDNSISFSSKVYSNKVLDLSGGSTVDGTPVVLWEKNGETNQEWRLVASS